MKTSLLGSFLLAALTLPTLAPTPAQAGTPVHYFFTSSGKTILKTARFCQGEICGSSWGYLTNIKSSDVWARSRSQTSIGNFERVLIERKDIGPTSYVFVEYATSGPYKGELCAGVAHFQHEQGNTVDLSLHYESNQFASKYLAPGASVKRCGAPVNSRIEQEFHIGSYHVESAARNADHDPAQWTQTRRWEGVDTNPQTLRMYR